MNRRFQILALLCLTLGLAPVGTRPAVAQEDPTAASYITPFPEGDTYKLQVVGDPLAEGALQGLLEAFGSDSRLQINRKHRVIAGLARLEAEDDAKALDEALTKEPNHITIVMVGQNDRTPIRVPGGKRLAVGKDEWREEYGRRVDRLVKILKKRGGAVYWIGLPVMRKTDWNEDIQVMNDIVRERAYLNGIKYIDAFAGLADEGGNFVAMGPDVAGLVRRLRESDGVSFTPAGNRKLAHFVEREIRRDLTQAKNERAIPLAGAEAEQRKINPQHAVAEQVPITKAAAPKAGETKSSWASTTNTAPQPTPFTSTTATEQKADNSRISLRTVTPGGKEETATLDILRPAIPASVIQLMARNASPEKATQVGDTLQENLPGGLLLLSSVSPATEGMGPGRRAKLAPTQTPYFKVMVKGERLPPKPGRADDFRWPRPDQAPEPAPAPVAQPAAAPAAPAPAPAQPKAGSPRPAPTPKSTPPRP
jgi:uncharacterized protein